MRKAIVNAAGNIVNVIEIADDAVYSVDAGFYLVPADNKAESGGLYKAGVFTPEPRVQAVGVPSFSLRDSAIDVLLLSEAAKPGASKELTDFSVSILARQP